MVWDLKESKEIYSNLREVSAKILTALGCFTEPHEINGKGKTRTKMWELKDGKRCYRGIIFHYTGGVSGIKSMRWANHPDWGNEESSWHVTIFDRITENIVGELWSKLDSKLLQLFPAPTVVMADWRWGTWHGNWTNDVTLGVENRNVGPLDYAIGLDFLKKLGKKGIEIKGYLWEPYTLEQMICNINIGRLANGLVEGRLDPDWILPHQCVWATKKDTGPAYLIHDVRRAIFSDKPIEQHHWLKAYKPASGTDDGDLLGWKYPYSMGSRNEAEEDFVKWVIPAPEVIEAETSPMLTVRQLYSMGFNTGPELPSIDSLRKQVRWFQRSTGAFRKSNPKRVLVCDGIVGEKTRNMLTERLQQLRLLQWNSPEIV